MQPGYVGVGCWNGSDNEPKELFILAIIPGRREINYCMIKMKNIRI